MKLTRVLVALLLFGIAFGCIEAAVVVYLRTLGEPIREKVLANQPHDGIFPLLTLEQWKDAGMDFMPLAITELIRELATMLLLVSIGLAHARNVREWFAGFMIAFGVWDIFYYVFLKLFVGWPASLWTWDLLFLIPVPWSGPVITPVLVSLAMIAAGVEILRREAAGMAVHLRPADWAAIFVGGLVVIVAFCWDYPHTAKGGMPNPFNWPLFLVGMAIGIAGFVHALRLPPTNRQTTPTLQGAS
jgi:hypothetical protein